MNENSNPNNIDKFTGFNKILKSKFVQFIVDKLDDGTFADFFDDWKWIFGFSKKYKGAIAFYLVLGVLSSTLSLGAAVVSKYMIDIIVKRQIDKLWVLAFMMIFSTIFSLVFSSLVSRLSAKISIYVNNDIQASIFDKIIDADWLAINKYENGDILNRFNTDVSTVANNAVNWIPTLVINLYTFIATLVVILYYDVTMALIAFVSAPVLLLASRYIMRKMQEYRKRVLEMNSKLMSFEVETFYNFDTIKSFGITKHYGKELRKWQDKYKDYNLDYNMFSIKTNIGLSVLAMVVEFLAFGYCLFRLWTNSITFGTMTLFLQQRSKLSSNFNTLVGIIPGMLNSAVSAHRIREIVELPKEIHDEESAELLSKTADCGLTIEVKDMEFGYVEGTSVIENSTFIAKPNEIVALVGPSGEGKTTMLRMILGLIHPDKGSASLIDKDGNVVSMNADVRKFFSYVPQGNTIISGTIAENMRMVKEDATDEEIIEALKMACAWSFVEKMDNGINSTIGERGKGVSEGQAQRLSIARALMRNSPILLLDEATSALDIEVERQILKNIIKQHPNKTCIVSTHRLSVLPMCQRIYKVSDKRIIEQNIEDYVDINDKI